MWTIFKVFIEFVTILLLFYVLFLWPGGTWDLSSPTKDQTCTPLTGRWSLNHCPSHELFFLRKERTFTECAQERGYGAEAKLDSIGKIKTRPRVGIGQRCPRSLGGHVLTSTTSGTWNSCHSLQAGEALEPDSGTGRTPWAPTGASWITVDGSPGSYMNLRN